MIYIFPPSFGMSYLGAITNPESYNPQRTHTQAHKNEAAISRILNLKSIRNPVGPCVASGRAKQVPTGRGKEESKA